MCHNCEKSMRWIMTNCFTLFKCKDLKFAICLKQWVGLTLDIWPWIYNLNENIFAIQKSNGVLKTLVLFFNKYLCRTQKISCGGGIIFFEHTHKQKVPTKSWWPSEVEPIFSLYARRLFLSPYALCLHVHQRLKCTLSSKQDRSSPHFEKEKKVHRFINI